MLSAQTFPFYRSSIILRSMFERIREYYKSHSQRWQFILINGLFLALIVFTTIYCYVRLDYVRSGHTPRINPVSYPFPQLAEKFKNSP